MVKKNERLYPQILTPYPSVKNHLHLHFKDQLLGYVILFFSRSTEHQQQL